MDYRQAISNVEFKLSAGFLYWLNETYNIRGLKTEKGTIPITEYPAMIQKLQKEYNEKYPNGLTGWTPH